MAEAPEVLFVCVHNAGRSQMAAALLDHHAHGRLRVRSAGSAPADRVNPAVIDVMAELGIDISHNVPVKLLTDHVAASDVVITMGCGDVCPIYPGKRYEDWNVPDPADKTLQEVRPIRDEIDRRVVQILAELLPEPRPEAELDSQLVASPAEAATDQPGSPPPRPASTAEGRMSPASGHPDKGC